MFILAFVDTCLYQVEEILFCSYFMYFYHEECWIFLLDAFSASLKVIMWFCPLFSWYNVYYFGWFLYLESALHSWDKSHLQIPVSVLWYFIFSSSVQKATTLCEGLLSFMCGFVGKTLAVCTVGLKRVWVCPDLRDTSSGPFFSPGFSAWLTDLWWPVWSMARDAGHFLWTTLRVETTTWSNLLLLSPDHVAYRWGGQWHRGGRVDQRWVVGLVFQ